MAARLRSDGWREEISRRERWSDAEKRFAFWALRSARRIARILRGDSIATPKAAISSQAQAGVLLRLRRDLRTTVGKPPRVRTKRSASFDGCMYRVFDKKKRQYIALMGLARGKRIVLPLAGNTVIHGDIRLVLADGKASIHYSVPVRARRAAAGESVAIDAGLSEVLTDDRGKRYGKDFGALLVKLSKAHKDNGRKRGKIRALAENSKDPAKDRRIRRNNLGGRKRKRRLRKAQAEVERQVNTAMRAFLRERHPAVFAREVLDFRGKAKSKETSRRIIQMRAGVLQERIDFLASVGGSRREKANPAYGSQACPGCDYVHPKNRAGDRFACRHCGHESHSDRIGACNLKRRIGDPDILPWTPRARVKAILLARFSRRSGKPPDWKPGKGDCSGAEDSRHRTTAADGGEAGAPNGRTVGALAENPPPMRWDHAGQPENETAKAIQGLTLSKTMAKRTRSFVRKYV